MFSGEYEHTLDEKGRLIIPAKFRAELDEGLFVTRGLDGCLFVFPPDGWKDLSEKMANLSLVQAGARLFSRMIYSGIECNLDKQGRILLPPSLRAHADIESEVVITGVRNRVEIWSKKRWQVMTTRMEDESSSIAEQLANLGI
ncbi:MAG: division/cell wall cluster transcriptional repressor MraZ [Anaerolineales bacterium]|nr:division/cell wall cluster transcriptional repressor MraZ [Anaerolineales bacterium]